jgi:hypothetical protein
VAYPKVAKSLHVSRNRRGNQSFLHKVDIGGSLEHDVVVWSFAEALSCVMSLVNPLNPSAGGVPFPDDQRETKAALRAGVISYRLFPYLAWRYGQRGSKFTRSDSAWLAWLTRHSQARVDEQIAWLRNVLSNRGMPSWILEVHLRVLYRQLIRTIPANAQKYVTLIRSAERLRGISEDSISAPCAQQLVADFATAVGPSSNSLLTSAAQLLVSAVSDEKSGVKNAVSSLETWLVDVPKLREIAAIRARLSPADRRLFDSDAFTRRWQKAIESTIAQARRN